MTLLYSDFVAGVRTLGQSLRNTNTMADLVVFVTPDVSMTAMAVLEADGWIVRPVEPLSNPNRHARKQLHHVFTRLRVFTLVEYERVILLDGYDSLTHSLKHTHTHTHSFCINTLNPKRQ